MEGVTQVKRYAGDMRTLITVSVLAGALVAPTAASAEDVVLGNAEFAPPYSEGFGKPHPRKVYNGGVPSGLVRKIRWTGWGSPKALGYGQTFIYKPRGGYYDKPVRARLKATRLGPDRRADTTAYHRLWIRVPRRPGGRLGRWHLWSGVKDLCRPWYQ
jgi:hypothetical protein